MFRVLLPWARKVSCFPRARGDVPKLFDILTKICAFSPRTRGCSGHGVCHAEDIVVFPAHAGMFRTSVKIMVMSWCFPRARGDVPQPCKKWCQSSTFSPRTRGCSVAEQLRSGQFGVFPAHAGMFRMQDLRETDKMSFPRARGDVPAASGGC